MLFDTNVNWRVLEVIEKSEIHTQQADGRMEDKENEKKRRLDCPMKTTVKDFRVMEKRRRI